MAARAPTHSNLLINPALGTIASVQPSPSPHPQSAIRNPQSPSMSGEERMLAACRLEAVDTTPVWFMRQAGRCLAPYRRLRERYDVLTIARTPDLCAQVTTMPIDVFGVDAAVMYADIMLPLDGMGVPFVIEPEIGPIIEHPIRTAADVAGL